MVYKFFDKKSAGSGIDNNNNSNNNINNIIVIIVRLNKIYNYLKNYINQLLENL